MREELEKILENGEFLKELMLKKTREEAKKAIEEKGVLATDEEMEEIYKFYSSLYKECQKMSKEELLQVSGGFRLPWPFRSSSSSDDSLDDQGQSSAESDLDVCPATDLEEKTWMGFAKENKGKISAGAAALALCAFYGIKNIKGYLSSKKKSKKLNK